MRILTEASGSLVAGYLIKAIKDTGHQAIGSDINRFNAAVCLCDDFIVFPRIDDPNLWEKVEHLLFYHNLEIVIPSLDEMMVGWTERKQYFEEKGIFIVISPLETIKVFQDKWETYLFFKSANIPCPETSLEQNYPLIKPRCGRGSRGVKLVSETVDMTNMISQEVLTGEEYTIDAFFDFEFKPVYIVPRKRIDVREGKSIKGIVVKNDKIESYVRQIAENIKFTGPINFQCFVENDNVSFVEVNPRIAGGTALCFAATENWVRLIIDNLILKKEIIPKSIKYNLTMARYYAECYFS